MKAAQSIWRPPNHRGELIPGIVLITGRSSGKTAALKVLKEFDELVRAANEIKIFEEPAASASTWRKPATNGSKFF